jgi:hypothetical protein
MGCGSSTSTNDTKETIKGKHSEKQNAGASGGDSKSKSTQKAPVGKSAPAKGIIAGIMTSRH